MTLSNIEIPTPIIPPTSQDNVDPDSSLPQPTPPDSPLSSSENSYQLPSLLDSPVPQNPPTLTPNPTPSSVSTMTSSNRDAILQQFDETTSDEDSLSWDAHEDSIRLSNRLDLAFSNESDNEVFEDIQEEEEVNSNDNTLEASNTLEEIEASPNNSPDIITSDVSSIMLSDEEYFPTEEDSDSSANTSPAVTRQRKASDTRTASTSSTTDNEDHFDRAASSRAPLNSRKTTYKQSLEKLSGPHDGASEHM